MHQFPSFLSLLTCGSARASLERGIAAPFAVGRRSPALVEIVSRSGRSDTCCSLLCSFSGGKKREKKEEEEVCLIAPAEKRRRRGRKKGCC